MARAKVLDDLKQGRSEVLRYSRHVSKILLTARAYIFQVEPLFEAKFSM
jgi:hypothetical protein